MTTIQIIQAISLILFILSIANMVLAFSLEKYAPGIVNAVGGILILVPFFLARGKQESLAKLSMSLILSIGIIAGALVIGGFSNMGYFANLPLILTYMFFFQERGWRFVLSFSAAVLAVLTYLSECIFVTMSRPDHLMDNLILELSIIAALFTIVVFFMELFFRDHQRTLKKLSVSNQNMEEMLHMISHDLRGAFGAFATVTEDLNREDLCSDMEEILLEIHKKSHQIQGLVDNIFEWARSNQEMISVSPKDFGVADFLETLVGRIEVLANQKSITLVLENQSSAQVHTDFFLLETILRNLLANAIKFTPERGKVILGAKEGEERLELFVQDQGSGLPQSLIENFNESSHFAIRSGTAGEMGSGLGLVLARRFTSMIGGELSFQSTPSGTTFFLSIPKTLDKGI